MMLLCLNPQVPQDEALTPKLLPLPPWTPGPCLTWLLAFLTSVTAHTHSESCCLRTRSLLAQAVSDAPHALMLYICCLPVPYRQANLSSFITIRLRQARAQPDLPGQPALSATCSHRERSLSFSSVFIFINCHQAFELLEFKVNLNSLSQGSRPSLFSLCFLVP